jgi:hypothetical protein
MHVRVVAFFICKPNCGRIRCSWYSWKALNESDLIEIYFIIFRFKVWKKFEFLVDFVILEIKTNYKNLILEEKIS